MPSIIKEKKFGNPRAKKSHPGQKKGSNRKRENREHRVPPSRADIEAWSALSKKNSMNGGGGVVSGGEVHLGSSRFSMSYEEYRSLPRVLDSWDGECSKCGTMRNPSRKVTVEGYGYAKKIWKCRRCDNEMRE